MAMLAIAVVMLYHNGRRDVSASDITKSHIAVVQNIEESTIIEKSVNAETPQSQEPVVIGACNDDDKRCESNGIAACEEEDKDMVKDDNCVGMEDDNDVDDEKIDEDEDCSDDEDSDDEEDGSDDVIDKCAANVNARENHGVTKEKSVMALVERVCAGDRLPYKEWKVRLKREMGIDKLKDSLDDEFSRSGYWANRVESSGMTILVGRLTDSITGFISEGLGGGFTYPKWLPEHDAEYIYKAFWKLDAIENEFLKRMEAYDQAFKNSDFYITPEEEERIAQEKRREYAKPLFASICLIPKRYFCVQKRLGMSILSAKITDWRWNKLLDAQEKGDWLGMMSVIEYGDSDKKFEKYGRLPK